MRIPLSKQRPVAVRELARVRPADALAARAQQIQQQRYRQARAGRELVRPVTLGSQPVRAAFLKSTTTVQRGAIDVTIPLTNDGSALNLLSGWEWGASLWPMLGTLYGAVAYPGGSSGEITVGGNFDLTLDILDASNAVLKTAHVSGSLTITGEQTVRLSSGVVVDLADDYQATTVVDVSAFTFDTNGPVQDIWKLRWHGSSPSDLGYLYLYVYYYLTEPHIIEGYSA